MIRPLIIPSHKRTPLPEDPSADGRSHVDALWAWARFFFERLERIEDAKELAYRHKIPRRYQRDYLAWLEPIERLVRQVLIARAIAFLTMTDAGRRMLGATPKQPLPGPRPPPARKQQQEQQQQQEEEVRDLAPLARTPEEIEAAYLALPVRRKQTSDPSTWICPFAIIRFDRSHPPSEEGAHYEPTGLTYEEIAALDHIPIVRRTRPHGANHAPPIRRRGPHPAAIRLARRVEALGRVLANPARHIRRAARLLARLPAGCLAPPDPPRCWWMQGDDILRAAAKLYASALNALDALNRVHGMIPEPG